MIDLPCAHCAEPNQASATVCRNCGESPSTDDVECRACGGTGTDLENRAPWANWGGSDCAACNGHGWIEPPEVERRLKALEEMKHTREAA